MISLRARRFSKQTALPLEIGIRIPRGSSASAFRSSAHVILKICPRECNCCLGVERDLAGCGVCQ